LVSTVSEGSEQNPFSVIGPLLFSCMAHALLVFAGFIFLGGLSRLAAVTEKVVPFMAIVYLIGGIAVLIANASHVGDAFFLIFEFAFNPNAELGGVTFAFAKKALR